MVFLPKMVGYQKMCDTNKNVTKTSMIIKGVYCVKKNVSTSKHKHKNHNKIKKFYGCPCPWHQFTLNELFGVVHY